MGKIIAGIQSLIFPGLGQIYNDQEKKGVVFALIPFIGSLLCIPLLFLIFIFFGIYLIIFTLIFLFWIYNVVDAIINSSKSRSHYNYFRNSPHLFQKKLSIFVFILICIFNFSFLGFNSNALLHTFILNHNKIGIQNSEKPEVGAAGLGQQLINYIDLPKEMRQKVDQTNGKRGYFILPNKAEDGSFFIFINSGRTNKNGGYSIDASFENVNNQYKKTIVIVKEFQGNYENTPSQNITIWKLTGYSPNIEVRTKDEEVFLALLD